MTEGESPRCYGHDPEDDIANMHDVADVITPSEYLGWKIDCDMDGFRNRPITFPPIAIPSFSPEYDPDLLPDPMSGPYHERGETEWGRTR